MPLLDEVETREAQTAEILQATHSIDIFHPSLPGGPAMVHFTAYLTAPESTIEGLPLAFMLEACFLVAGNKAGVLQVCSTGEGFWPAEGDEDKLLGTGDYYFWVKSAEYAINMFSILQKLVPPLTIPARWVGGLYRAGEAGEKTVHGSAASAAVKWLDKTCIVTGATTALQASHCMVPKAEGEWGGPQHAGARPRSIYENGGSGTRPD
ncbi:hypothetical protein DFH08DRAFT_820170 [Mycena albidolilacea]|uniref:Uncharacterized protein n=1 Tax=Mycena albidolilacea TaxID=1033008 RepID=A0AAD6ZDP8_9AGAR|nr:hypothetical protein DFH08DRAFT_820170 [Mycena albidolilacea]